VKILVADEEPRVAELVREYLAGHGHDVLTAGNGLEALLHVKNARPDAAVLDLRMPRLGGLEALKRIRAFDTSIRVVLASAAPDEATQRAARELGVRAVLSKPVDLPALLTALDAAPAAASPAAASSVAASSVAASSVVPAPSAAPANERRNEGGTRVLVIDDDDRVRELLVEFLEMRGYDVAAAARAAAGTAAIADRTPDIVLLDIDMPGLSGADALPTIKAMAPRAAVIMVSGTDDEAVAKRTLAFGAFDYLVKPIDFEYLAQSLESALR
jgi:DNA-binding response OmpR family regulator